MTKGVGFLPLLMLIPFALWRGHAGTGPMGKVWGARNWLGLLVLLGTLALWLGPMLWAVAASGSEELRAYRDDILLRQTAGRYAHPWGHINAWHYLFTAAIPAVWLPLLLLLLTQWRRLGRLLKEDSTARVLFTWVLMVLVFFSLSRGKRVVYILPALPMLSLVAGALWQRALDEGGTRTSSAVLRALPVLLGLGLLVLGATAGLQPARLGAKAGDYGDALAQIALPVSCLGAATLALTAWTWRRAVLEQLALVSLLCWFTLSWWVWPAMDSQRTPQAVMQALERTVAARQEVGLLQFKEQFLLFSKRPLTHFSALAPVPDQERNAWRWMREDPGRVLLVPDSLALACFDMGQLRVLGKAHRQRWGLLDAAAMAPDCEPPRQARRYVWRPQRTDVMGD
jgi:4-amino-4-deoxy-L-arabinose transferase-like glycosyltransferase